jgi:methyl-accepting chemotaxis protein
VRSLPIAPRAEVINRYIVLQPHRDEFDQVIGQVKDQVHKQLLTDLGNRIDRDFQSEIRRIALEAHHDLDDTVTNTNARMHEQIGTVKDLSKAHNKLAATVKDLQTTMQKQNEQLKYDTGQ